MLLLVASAAAAKFHPAVAVHSAPTAELARLGESGTVEFKSTARRNLHSGERDARIEMARGAWPRRAASPPAR